MENDLCSIELVHIRTSKAKFLFESATYGLADTYKHVLQCSQKISFSYLRHKMGAPLLCRCTEAPDAD